MTKRVAIEYKDTWTEISVPKDATILRKVARQTIFAGEVSPGLIREIGAIPSRDFDEALALGREMVGGNPDILVLPRYLRDPKPIYEVIS